MRTKSPFTVIEEFISPLMCEDIIDGCDFNFPDKDENKRDIKTVRSNRIAESRIFTQLEPLISELERYYGFEYRGTLPFDFEWYPTGSSEPAQRCESQQFMHGKWTTINDYGLTGVIFLKDYLDGKNIDTDFEVYGGKLDFPVHQFGFLPQRGTLILFPSERHFVNFTNKVLVGDLMQIRIQIATMKPYVYDRNKFPGDYTVWFK